MKKVYATFTVKVILTTDDEFPVYDQVDLRSMIISEAIENLEGIIAVEDIKSEVRSVFNRQRPTVNC